MLDRCNGPEDLLVMARVTAARMLQPVSLYRLKGEGESNPATRQLDAPPRLLSLPCIDESSR